MSRSTYVFYIFIAHLKSYFNRWTFSKKNRSNLFLRRQLKFHDVCQKMTHIVVEVQYHHLFGKIIFDQKIEPPKTPSIFPWNLDRTIITGENLITDLTWPATNNAFESSFNFRNATYLTSNSCLKQLISFIYFNQIGDFCDFFVLKIVIFGCIEVSTGIEIHTYQTCMKIIFWKKHISIVARNKQDIIKTGTWKVVRNIRTFLFGNKNELILAMTEENKWPNSYSN